MTLYTQPDGFPFPESGDNVAPLEEYIEDLAVAMQASALRGGAVANAAARDAAIPSPVAGQSVWRLDTGWREVYYPAGLVRVAGWYPVSGALPLVQATNPTSMQVLGSSSSNLKFTAVDLSRNANYSLSTGVMTVTQPGLYLVSGYVRMSTAPAGAVRLQVSLNGNPTQMSYVNNLVGTPVAHQLVCSAGDQLAVTVVNGDGNAQTVATSNRGETFSYLGPA
ncbi:hypothetical protein [Curtobacterium flaccumfaciens]|uniref:hypothetical protein n=1 Tax=Curtobacterium flaccumfaciens TaxID=2035 RepID=UPI001129A68A|nr:hypothetical protein [Curtobacterium flaccumfaciens]TPG09397.1 hypothetical protein EAH85_03805 [Curtobacterium flaccumfaciens]